ncbi:sensor domain-containing protein [Marinobacterium arenosum]|uniref:sensor domain-containing protein n=1 Tax=Marinobacterium arenosum TaxID=2862496 RepID=UPI001C9803E6|nr:diguanylate cyclase [Marinobacterium arenosum]MBY4678953.1 diguanylate cyclase [Marinobacterium arenosum]
MELTLTFLFLAQVILVFVLMIRVVRKNASGGLPSGVRWLVAVFFTFTLLFVVIYPELRLQVLFEENVAAGLFEPLYPTLGLLVALCGLFGLNRLMHAWQHQQSRIVLLENDQQRFAKSRLQHEQEILAIKRLYQQSSHPVFLYWQQRIIETNEAAVELLGRKNRDQVLGRALTDLLINDIEQREALESWLKDCQQQGCDRLQTAFEHQLGGEVPVELSALPIYYRSRTVLLIWCRDMTAELRHQARQTRVERRLQAVLEANDLAVVEWAQDGTLLTVDPRLAELMHWLPESLKEGMDFCDWWLERCEPRDRRRLSEQLTELDQGRSPFISGQFRVSTLQGDSAELVHQSTLVEQDGRSIIISCFADLTERYADERLLKRLSAAVYHSSTATVVLDQDLRVEYVNPAFARFVKRSRLECTGMTLPNLGECFVDSEQRTRCLRTIQAGRSWRGELKLANSDKSVRWLQVTVTPVDTGSGIQYVMVAENITLLKERARRLSRKALYDNLTGLPNRYLFLDRLEHALAAQQRDGVAAALMFIDLDNFKPINDTYGHGTGDDLLKEVAARLKSTVREEDTVARLGGDEFVVLLRNVEKPDRVQEAAQRIAEAMARRVNLPGDIELDLSLSIGLALAPEDGETAQQLMDHADQAMYNAKKWQGLKCIRYGDPDAEPDPEQAAEPSRRAAV